MALIEWQERFRIGIESVDYEHQEMIALLNELYEGLTQDTGEPDVVAFLGEVYARISAHFALEEREMKQRRYDQYAEHKASHEELLDEIRDIMDDYELGDGELPVEAFQWYLDVRKYGSCPHGGFGMGIERFVAWMCGLKHLRESIPYPRMLHRIYP